MSLQKTTKRGDEYYTPKYIVEILLPFIKDKGFKNIWCPCDKEWSEYVKVFIDEGLNVIHTHIEDGYDFIDYEPKDEYDIIITNPPFSIKNEIFERCINLNKPFCLLMSATSIQSASFIKTIAKAPDFNVMMFDKRISYNGDRPPFPSWYYSSGLFDKTEFYIYKENPKDLFKRWEEKKEEKENKKLPLFNELN
tara:strand:+ start:99 stop:680 length:582 start_codon:yes stop_codon:yes gene_type:complete